MRRTEALIDYGYREDDIRVLFDVEELVKFVAAREGVPDSSEVSVSFVRDESIHELNRTWRGIDRPTDVLSFECDGLGSGAPQDGGASLELGDVVIAPDVAERQAGEYGLSFADEVSLLVTHGLLHLCGYDHEHDDEARLMEARERELLSEFWKRPFKRTAEETL